MDLVAGAMGNLVPKLLQLLQDEYKLQKGVKQQVENLAKELKSIHIALSKVAQVPYDQLDPQVKLWANEAREASYDMEDILDTFFARVEGCRQHTDTDDKGNVQRLLEKMGNVFNFRKLKARRDIAYAIEEITKQVDEMAKRRERNKVDDVVAKSSTTSIDPRLLMTLRTQASQLVGIDEPRAKLIQMLTIGDESEKKTKVVSVVGSGGLGKTTIAKVVYEELTMSMNIHYKAFVPVGRNPDLKKVFREILLDLDNDQYMNKTNFTLLDERLLIKEIQTFLKEKRYFIVIDDVWEKPMGDAIKIAFKDNNMGSKIMITTRSSDVAKLAHCTYKIQPLSLDFSKILFYERVFGSRDRCPKEFSELSDKILQKCDGVPLAIITMASMLANKLDDTSFWQGVCSSIGHGLTRSNDEYDNMKKILLFSYYDLPSQMKTCFLYLSMYPEDYKINRNELIWKWISEGFIQPENDGDDLFELGKSYFNGLINRSLVVPVIQHFSEEISGCRVHDIILDLICSLSREENFVTTSHDIEKAMSSKSKTLCRLSLNDTAIWPKKGVTKVRSVVAFGCSLNSMQSLSQFVMLRVLDLKGCSLKDYDASNKLDIGNLIHLRYLGLGGTGLIGHLRGIKKLRFLQVLTSADYLELPGNQLRNLVSLQVLNTLHLSKDFFFEKNLSKDSIGTVQALGHLTQLKELSIFIESDMVDWSVCETALIDSLGNMPRLEVLHINGRVSNMNWARWVPPPHLCNFIVSFNSSLMLPKWVSPVRLPRLTYLDIVVHTVRPEDIQILGMLPNLRTLELSGDFQNFCMLPLQKWTVSTDALFPCLRECTFMSILIVPSMFTRGAMSQVQDITFSVRTRDFFTNPSGFDFGDLSMDHLPSLKRVHVVIHIRKSEVEPTKLMEALKHACDVHPNRPNLTTHITK